MEKVECSRCGRDNFARVQDLRAHERWKAKNPDADHPATEAQLELATLSQDKPAAAATLDVNDLVSKLAPAIAKAISTPATPTTPAVDTIPSLDTVVAHCEGGTCDAHMKQLDQLKTRIVTAAFEAMPDEVVKAKAEKLGMVEKPRDIRIAMAQQGARP